MQINSAVNLAGLCTPLNSKAESSFLVYISDYCTVIKECRGGNICFGTPSTHSTARGEEIVGVCVPHKKRRNAKAKTQNSQRQENLRGEDSVPCSTVQSRAPAELLPPLSISYPFCLQATASKLCNTHLAVCHEEQLRDVIPQHDMFSPDAN